MLVEIAQYIVINLSVAFILGLVLVILLEEVIKRSLMLYKIVQIQTQIL